jgi:hypothetical protein
MNQHLPPLAITDPTFTFQLSASLFDSNLKDRNDRGDVGDGAPYLYDAIASMGLAACAVATTSSSSSSSSSFSRSSTPLDGKNVHAKAKQQSFIGVSGRVEYNEEGSRSAETGRVEMTNLRITTEGGVSTALVAFFSGGNWTFEDVDVWYAGNGTSPPPWRDPPSVDLHLIDEGIKVFMYENLFPHVVFFSLFFKAFLFFSLSLPLTHIIHVHNLLLSRSLVLSFLFHVSFFFRFCFMQLRHGWCGVCSCSLLRCLDCLFSECSGSQSIAANVSSTCLRWSHRLHLCRTTFEPRPGQQHYKSQRLMSIACSSLHHRLLCDIRLSLCQAVSRLVGVS